MKLSKLLNRKGATLIEMMAVIAILLIILVPISSFLINNYKTYNVARAQIDAQQDAQKTMSLLINRAMGARGMTITQSATPGNPDVRFEFDMGSADRWFFHYDSTADVLYANEALGSAALIPYASNIVAFEVEILNAGEGVTFTLQSSSAGENIELNNEVFFRNR